MEERKFKHLEFIQQAVNRMASNLFLLKGWTVTLIAALFALAAKDSKDIFFLIAYFPPLMFWCSRPDGSGENGRDLVRGARPAEIASNLRSQRRFLSARFLSRPSLRSFSRQESASMSRT